MESLDFRFKKIDKTRTYLLEKTKDNDLMMYKACVMLFFEHFFVLVSAISGCISIVALTFTLGLRVKFIVK